VTALIATVFAMAIALVVVAIFIYNGLVSARLRVSEGWSAIDVQLKRRADLIPNLIETVKSYADYERGTMERVAAARVALTAATGPVAAGHADAILTDALQRFFAVAEAYPDLKASERFAQLQRDLADTENKIAFARNYYNGAVEIFNIRAQTFPSLLVASAFGFKPAEFFAAPDVTNR